MILECLKTSVGECRKTFCTAALWRAHEGVFPISGTCSFFPCVIQTEINVGQHAWMNGLTTVPQYQ